MILDYLMRFAIGRWICGTVLIFLALIIAATLRDPEDLRRRAAVGDALSMLGRQPGLAEDADGRVVLMTGRLDGAGELEDWAFGISAPGASALSRRVYWGKSGEDDASLITRESWETGIEFGGPPDRPFSGVMVAPEVTIDALHLDPDIFALSPTGHWESVPAPAAGDAAPGEEETVLGRESGERRHARHAVLRPGTVTVLAARGKAGAALVPVRTPHGPAAIIGAGELGADDLGEPARHYSLWPVALVLLCAGGASGTLAGLARRNRQVDGPAVWATILGGLGLFGFIWFVQPLSPARVSAGVFALYNLACLAAFIAGRGQRPKEI
jgi:hypothetical protein